jgi:signal-transduction protein with cAMP-binding, CBS, and nucleotidyltransferase domain
MDGENLAGFITQREIIRGVHEKSKEATAREIMRVDIPSVRLTDDLYEVQSVMQRSVSGALPVERDGRIVGVITAGDISRIYVLESEKNSVA